MFDFIRPIFRNLFKKPVTRAYPFFVRDSFANARGHISGIDDTCIYCGICEKKCPADAIKVDKQNKIWNLDQYKCVVCNVCVEVCPKHCINMDTHHKTAEYKKAIVTIAKPQVESAETTAPKKIVGIDKEACVYCTLCAKKCPQEAITVSREDKTWAIDQDKCVNCMICVDKCPKKCIITE